MNTVILLVAAIFVFFVIYTVLKNKNTNPVPNPTPDPEPIVNPEDPNYVDPNAPAHGGE